MPRTQVVIKFAYYRYKNIASMFIFG